MATIAQRATDPAKKRVFKPWQRRSGMVRLTWDLVREVRAKARQGTSRADLAAEFHISASQVWWIVRGWPDAVTPDALNDRERIPDTALAHAKATLHACEIAASATVLDDNDAPGRVVVFRILQALLEEAQQGRAMG